MQRSRGLRTYFINRIHHIIGSLQTSTVSSSPDGSAQKRKVNKQVLSTVLVQGWNQKRILNLLTAQSSCLGVA